MDERYQRYLCSREWSILRNKVNERCNGTCERCRRAPTSHVHHLTYARKYNELLEDLQGLCKACHEFMHGKRSQDPIINHYPFTFVSNGVSDIKKMSPKDILPNIGRMVSTEVPTFEGEGIVCPYCNYEYVHFKEPTKKDGHDNYKAGWTGRGDLIVIPFWGECGHKWELCFGFHKGHTEAFIKNMPITEDEEEEEEEIEDNFDEEEEEDY